MKYHLLKYASIFRVPTEIDHPNEEHPYKEIDSDCYTVIEIDVKLMDKETYAFIFFFLRFEFVPIMGICK